MSYYISAENWRGLGRVVDRVLDEYTTSSKGLWLFRVLMFNYMFIIIGPDQFTSYALEIAPSVQELQTQSSIQGIFVHRLIFQFGLLDITRLSKNRNIVMQLQILWPYSLKKWHPLHGGLLRFATPSNFLATVSSKLGWLIVCRNF